MSQHIDPTESLPAGVAGRINPVCDRFEKAWQTGGRPRLEEFLPQAEAADQPWLLRELLRLEVFYRGRSGETPTAEEYRRRLPDHAALIEEAFAALPTADPHATRYSDTPAVADPHATRYSDTPAAEAPSSRLPRRFGGYELLEEIGHGGMGVVYKARQFSPERLVALKVIRAGQLADEEDVRRFRQEADEAARLDHPNIVPVYEVGEQDGLHFFTMKLVEGGGLDKHLERYRNDPKAAARLTATAARAVHHAHQRQLLHRDLKPGNILLDAAGQPHVADFGLAKRMEGDGAAMTRSNAIVGTPEYMAPEQASGEKRLTTAIDVYALGGVLYALLAGRPPFQAKAPLDVLMKVVSEAPAPPSKVRPGAPHDLETICLKCLVKEPAKRYGSAEALAEDLERWLKGEPVRGRPVGRLERAWMWYRRNPVVANLTAVVAGLVVSAAVAAAVAAVYFQQLAGSEANARRDVQDAKGKLEAALGKETVLAGENLDLANREHAAQVNAVDRLERQYVGAGARLLDGNDLLGSLPWFTEALRLREKEPEAQAVHRVRLAAVLRQAPVPVHTWFPEGGVNDAEFSPDGKLVITAGQDGAVRIWDTVTGQTVGTLLKPKGERGLQPIRPEWRRGLADRRAWAVDEPLAMPASPFPDGRVYQATFSPDGRRIVMVSDDCCGRVWDAVTGRASAPGLDHSDSLGWYSPHNRACFSPDGRWVATAGQQGHGWIGDAETGKPLGKPLKHGGWINDVSFNPAGDRLLTASEDGTVRLWEAPSGEPVGTSLVHPAAVTHARFSPDGRRILSTCLDLACVWDVTAGKLAASPMIHQSTVNDAVFSPDGRLAATACSDGNARIWDTDRGLLLTRPLPHTSPPQRVVFSPDGRWLAVSCSDGTVCVWDVDEARQVRSSLPGGGKAVSFSPDGRRLLLSDGDVVRVWEVAVDDRPAPQPLNLRDRIDWAVFSGDRQRALVTQGLRYFDASARAALIDRPTGNTIVLPLEAGCSVMAASLSSDGRRAVTANNRRTIQVWDTTTGKEIAAVKDVYMPLDVCFSADAERVAAVFVEGPEELLFDHAAVWNASDGQLVQHWQVPGRNVLSVAFSPDGSRLVTGTGRYLVGGEKGTAQVWDVATGKAVGPPLFHAGDVWRARFSHDGKKVVTASSDHTARVWDAETGKPLLPPLRSGGRVYDASFSDDDQYIATGGDREGGEPGKGGFYEDFAGEEPWWVIFNASPEYDVYTSLRVNDSVPGEVRVWDAHTGDPVTPPLRQPRRVREVVRFDKDGRLLTASRGPYEEWAWDLRPDGRPVEQLVFLARAYAGMQVDDTGGYVPTDLPGALKALADRYPTPPTKPSPQEEADWDERQAAECEKAGRWFGAAWHLDRLIRGEGAEKGPLYARRGEAYRRLERWADALRDLDEAIRNDVKELPTWQARGYVHAALGQWKEAGEDYAEAVRLAADRLPKEVGEEELSLWSEQALVQLAQGDLTQYRASSRSPDGPFWQDLGSCVGPTRRVGLRPGPGSRHGPLPSSGSGQDGRAAPCPGAGLLAHPGGRPVPGGAVGPSSQAGE